VPEIRPFRALRFEPDIVGDLMDDRYRRAARTFVAARAGRRSRNRDVKVVACRI
jgi:hypothetical protein